MNNLEVAAIRYGGGDGGFRSLAAFEAAYRARESMGGAPEGVRWSPQTGWVDKWTPATASSHLLRRHMRNVALMAGASPVLPERGGTHRTPEVEREMLDYLRRMHKRDERLRDRIRSQVVV